MGADRAPARARLWLWEGNSRSGDAALTAAEMMAGVMGENGSAAVRGAATGDTGSGGTGSRAASSRSASTVSGASSPSLTSRLLLGRSRPPGDARRRMDDCEALACTSGRASPSSISAGTSSDAIERFERQVPPGIKSWDGSSVRVADDLAAGGHPTVVRG
jgi:hypothetical protein